MNKHGLEATTLVTHNSPGKKVLLASTKYAKATGYRCVNIKTVLILSGKSRNKLELQRISGRGMQL
ncbi:hypothetical protein LR48_Vigan09g130600 [Vigna angularis]|uniref:Uncharacterized protein n=1 Tax=Phaseolus angularis TaxID=3914 RepID=A0A0L9VCK2_PHAAN|nr:hypothetical protein LR48_Vigan09g130600 [Vigna angularis]